MKTFIDCHCHIFNLTDIPLYESINGMLNVNVVKKLVLSIGGSSLIGIGRLDDFIGKKVEEKEAFIRYFERDLRDTIVKFDKHLLETITETDSEILITPLIMDFDCINGVEQNSLKKSNLELQTERLVSAIKESDTKIKICPFIGYDLRKLILKQDPITKEYLEKDYLSKEESAERLDKFKILYKEYASKSKRTSIKELENGEILGIKLYPPIGFNPYPKNEKKKNKYIEFYKWCMKEDIPITVHCQKGSYNADLKQKLINDVTDPKNWERLMRKEKLDKLRINFAHFGGEDGVEDMIEAWYEKPFKQIDKNSWTYTIIQLLKNYDNTYSDLSAYNYGKAKWYDLKGRLDDYSENLKKVFEYDEKGKFGKKGHKLEDKILWGSDVPMVISDKSYGGKYKNYYQKFEDVINECDFTEDHKKKIINKITNINSKKFLKLK